MPTDETRPADGAELADDGQAGKGGPAAERLEVARLIPAPPAAIFPVLCDPDGHHLCP